LPLAENPRKRRLPPFGQTPEQAVETIPLQFHGLPDKRWQRKKIYYPHD
jgi:hypothetical protein